ncbi:MAG: hypothetical protein C5B51_30000 [Terriglobia bacterium]|nr:MAG: hypothetical protein C5B51_30000 [Terriglobia bacterium]
MQINKTTRPLAIAVLITTSAVTGAASSIHRLYSTTSTDGLTALAPLSTLNWFVTASDISGRLEVTAWKNNPAAGRIDRMGTMPGPSVMGDFDRKSAVARISGNRVVTASVDPIGTMRMTCWAVDGSGNVSQKGMFIDYGGSIVQFLAINTLDSSRVVTLVEIQNAYGVFADLAAWTVDSSGFVTLQGHTQFPAVLGYVALTSNGYGYLVTGFSGFGGLFLSSWIVDSNGNFTHSSDASLGTPMSNAYIALTPILGNGNFTVTSANGGTIVTQWNLSAWTGVMTELAYSNSDPAGNTVAAQVGNGVFTLGSTEPGIRADVWYGAVNGWYTDNAVATNPSYWYPYSAMTLSPNQVISASGNTANQMQLDVWQWNP